MPDTDQADTGTPRAVTLAGRLRLELFVWALDHRLQELPRRRRTGCRREVRQNLLAAAREAGTAEALRGIGGPSALARDYLSAEYGDRPRPHWPAAAAARVGGTSLLTFLPGQANAAAQAAIRAVNPHATGTFTVPGTRLLQHATVYIFSNGQSSQTGGDWTPLYYAMLAAAIIVAGRLWRLRPPNRPATQPRQSPA